MQAAGHQRRLGIEAEAEAIDDPGGNRNHILEGPGELDADQVGARIAAKVVIGELLLESCCKFEVGTGENRGRWIAPDDLACKGGPG